MYLIGWILWKLSRMSRSQINNILHKNAEWKSPPIRKIRLTIMRIWFRLLYYSPIISLCVILPIHGWDIWKLAIIKKKSCFVFELFLHRWMTLTAAFTDANSTTALPLFFLDIRMFRTSPYCKANIITAQWSPLQDG